MRRGWLIRSVVALAIGLLGGSVLFAVVALRPVIPPELSQQLAPDRTLIAKGAQLAAIGNCNVCHTRLDGPPFAGGRSIATPFGRVYATNITPDPDTGIGGWSEAAFERAMREGVSRDGHHLYPAFPYDHMAGACHTPRNALGAERREQAYAGGEADGWIAPALNAASPAAVPWDTERLYTYLRHGEESLHGSAAGPMAPVVSNLAGVPDADVRAIATYVAAVAGAPTRERQTDAEKVMARAKSPPAAAAGSPGSAGAAIYAGTCAQCHGEAGRAPANAALNLSLSSALRVPRPDNVLRIVRGGIRPDGDGRGPFMPGFAGVLTEAQTVALLGYLRSHFTDKPAWAGVEEAVRRAAQNQLDTSRSIREAQRQP